MNAAAPPHSYCSSPSGRTAAKPPAANWAPVYFSWQRELDPFPPLKPESFGSHAMSPAAAITGSPVADAGRTGNTLSRTDAHMPKRPNANRDRWSLMRSTLLLRATRLDEPALASLNHMRG